VFAGRTPFPMAKPRTKATKVSPPLTATASAATEFFFQLTPDKILDAVERFGFRCTGRSLALNSMENRVFEVEVEADEVQSPSDRFRVAKFYRPGRWTREQIQEEHDFLWELLSRDIPVIAPLKNKKDATIEELEGLPIYFTVFRKAGGRLRQEFDDEELLRLGRTIARLHQVGKSGISKHRVKLSPETYGEGSVEFLLRSPLLPDDFRQTYESVVSRLLNLLPPLFQGVTSIRLHGDCHYGNILWADSQPIFVDFDDMVVGPPVQDFWLLLPGRDEEAKRQLQVMFEGYEQMMPIDRGSVRLIEPLRALRLLHYSAWIGRRWDDPAFQLTFPWYGTPQYWREQIFALQEQIDMIQSDCWGS
jgi:Ser/Thr protein kinase RdoA (MazF antagonist)